MKIFEILDDELNISEGFLLCYENSDSYVIELNEDLTEWEAPLLFSEFVKRGIFTIPREESHLWVRERIIPPGRQNIGDILNTHHMEKYEEISFLEISHGRCIQDSMRLRKTEVLPDYVLLRQKKNLIDVTPLENNRLLCSFADKKMKVVSLSDCISYFEADRRADNKISKVLGNQALFESAAVSPGGYAATFNDSIDIPASSLYEIGDDMPISSDDIKLYVTRNALSTAEACQTLGCSRQNLAYLSKTGKLSPLKKDDSVSLYLKQDLEKVNDQ